MTLSPVQYRAPAPPAPRNTTTPERPPFNGRAVEANSEETEERAWNTFVRAMRQYDAAWDDLERAKAVLHSIHRSSVTSERTARQQVEELGQGFRTARQVMEAAYAVYLTKRAPRKRRAEWSRSFGLLDG